MKTIRFTSPWGDYAKGATAEVWAPGAELGPGTVDPQRASQLVADGIAVDADAEPAEKPTNRPKRAKAEG